MTNDIGERVARIEERVRRLDQFEDSMDMLIRKMDRMVMIGNTAIANMRTLKEETEKEIGTLMRGQQQLRTALRAHINRSPIQIIRQWRQDLTPIALIIGGLLYLFPEFTTRLGLGLLGASPG